MGFYGRHVLPRLIDLAMRQRQLEPYRRRLISAAEGRVLEIGLGAGANLPFYGAGVTALVGLEPSPQLIERARARSPKCPLQIVEATAESMPLETASFDTAVMSFTLCSLESAPAALAEARRVLRPGGSLLFVEHGRAPEAKVRRAQERLTPFWRRVAGGCRLDVDVEGALRAAGFRVHRLQADYLRTPSPFTFIYEGRATPH